MKQHDHLNKDDVIRAVVDENELTRAQRDHLAGCDACRDDRVRLENGLSSFARMAGEMVPPMRKTIMLPADERVYRARPVGLRLALGSAVAAAMVVIVAASFFMYHIPGDKSSAGTDVVALQQETVTDEVLMTEVAQLVDDPMPQAWSDMAIALDTDEDAMDAIVPGADDEYTLS